MKKIQFVLAIQCEDLKRLPSVWNVKLLHGTTGVTNFKLISPTENISKIVYTFENPNCIYSMMQSEQLENWHFSREYNFWTNGLIFIMITHTRPYSCKQKLLLVQDLSKPVVQKL